MPIQRQRIYTLAEVNSIVRASERRPSTQGARITGHTGQRHVLITNLELAERGDEFYQDPRRTIPLVCAFTGTPEALRAVTEALNSPLGQAALLHLDDVGRTGARVGIEAQVVPVQVRYSSGMDVVRVAAVPSVFVLLERIEEPAYFGLHVHTAYPILAFRRGRPAWQDSNRTWHV